MADVKFKGTDYSKIRAFDFKTLLSSEFNELQDIQNFFKGETAKASVGDGPSGESWKVAVKNSSEISIRPGIFLHNGNILHLTSSVDITYNDSSLVLQNNSRYIVFCSYTETEITYLDDPNIKDTLVGETSSRLGFEYTFGVHKEWSDIPVGTNYIPLANFVYKNIDLVSANLFDLRFKFAQNYVIDGLNVKSYTVDGTNAVITLESGSFSFLGIFKRLASPIDDSDLTFEIPLASSGTQSRYRIGYRLSSYLDSPYNIEKIVTSTLSTSNVKGPYISLFNITVDNSEAIQSETNDIRRYEPLSRKIVSNKNLALADLSFLKPLQAPSPNLSVFVNDGWYFYKGEYKYHIGSYKAHDAVLTDPEGDENYHRLDVAGLDETNTLKVYKGTEVLTPASPVENSSIPKNFTRIYEVIIHYDTSVITDASDPGNTVKGEIKDTRRILDYFPSADSVGISRLSFSGRGAGGIDSSGTEDTLQEALNDIDGALVRKEIVLDSLGLYAQDSNVKITFNASTGNITVGHDPYVSGNTDPATKIGIKVKNDSVDENTILIENTWDAELRKLSSGGVVPDSMHTHGGAGAQENGSPIKITKQIVENRVEDRIAYLSDFIVDEVLNSPFALIDADDGIPAHVSLNLNSSGALELTENGFELKVDKTKGLKTATEGLQIYLSDTQSGLAFSDDQSGNYFLRLDAGKGLAIDNANKLTLAIGAGRGLDFTVLDELIVSAPSEFIDDSKGLGVTGSAPAENLIVKRAGAIDYEGSGALQLYVTKGTNNTSESFLVEEVTNGTGQETWEKYIRVNIDEDAGLWSLGGLLGVNIGNGLTFSSGEIVVNADGTKGIEIETNIPKIKVDSTHSFAVTASGLQLLTKGSLGHVVDVGDQNKTKLTLDLGATNPTLQDDGTLSVKHDTLKGLEATLGGLAVNLDSSGGLEFGTSGGIKITETASATSTSIYLYGGIDSSNLVDSNTKLGTMGIFDTDTKSFKYVRPPEQASTPIDYKVSHLSSFSIGGTEIHFFGGIDIGDVESTTHIYYDTVGETWVPENPLIFSVSKATSLTLSSTKGIVFDGTDASRKIRIYNGSSWIDTGNVITEGTFAGPVTEGESLGSVASVLTSNSIMYTPGDDVGTFSNNFYEITFNTEHTDITNSALLVTTPITPSLMGYGAGVKIEQTASVIFIGGKNSSTHLSEAVKITQGGTVSSLARIPMHPVSDMSFGHTGNSAYIFCGLREVDSYVDNVLSYTSNGDYWTYEGKTLVKSSNGTATSVDA
jgi:hypothetical protein